MKMSIKRWWDDTGRVELKYSEKILSFATLFAANLTWTDLGKKTRDSAVRG